MNHFFEYLKKEEGLHYYQTADLIEVLSDFVRMHHPEIYEHLIDEFKKHSLDHNSQLPLKPPQK